MAEILQQEHKPKGVRKSKKANLKVDLTPMVDLGFLLISFFVFTTTLARPASMHLSIPDDRNIIDSSKAEASKTINLILGANNNMFYYEGNDIDNLKNIGSKASSFRNIIFKKKVLLRQQFGSDSVMIVLIKPTKNSTYANVVNAMNEMKISMIKTYVLMDATQTESDKVLKY